MVAGMPTLPRRIAITVATFVIGTSLVSAAPPKPAAADIKPLPPVGKSLAEGDKAELEAGVASLQKELGGLEQALAGKPQWLDLLPDVEIYLNAVRYPLVYHESIDVAKAKLAITAGLERAKSLRNGQAPWVTAGGARGYRSRIDGSAQPYVLAVPKNYHPGDSHKFRVDFFCHGRGEDLLELKMINQKPGTAENKFVVQPYGRYCCANKFAGEIDSLEILESLHKQYPIDDSRIVMTGFSMGGAAVWHLAVHYSDLWCATSPGAGFCETKIYQHLAEKGELATTPWYEQVLWHWYDAPDYVVNLADVPLIAYAGELDPQKQSGDIMEKAAAAEGIKLQRIWGPGVAHKYEPTAKAQLDKELDGYASTGRPIAPPQVRFETWTLRYNHMFWLSVDGLKQHWKKARVDADLVDGTVQIKTTNVTALTLSFPPGTCPLLGVPAVTIDGVKLTAPAVGPDKSWTARFARHADAWIVPGSDDALRKRPGLQGPIDDAFMDRFIVVRPTGQPMNAATGKWVEAELNHAVLQWHNIFRGEAVVKSDTEVSDADVAESNLVLWGDPSSNKVLARIIGKLPVGWDTANITLGAQKFDAASHVPVLIYPNPLNAKKYIVLNSGFTFREDTNGTNSRQVPKLPDYAVVDMTTPPSSHGPGKIVEAGFFGEYWELRDDHGKIEP
jgi:dienelactone hydrolase